MVFYRNGSGTASGISLLSSGALTYNWNDNYSAYSWSSGLTAPNGVWTFVALVITSSKATMYMQPAGSAMQSAVNNVSNATQAFSGVSYLGQDPLGSRFFNGSLDDVRIYNASLSATQVAQLYDSYYPPTVATAAAASPATVTGATATLSAAGSSVFGASSLTYTWSTIGIPPAAVTFSANGTNAAQSTVATFSKAGKYTLGVTIADPYGQFTTSNVNVTVNQTLTDIHVAGQPAVATAYDQFANPLVDQPAFNAGTITGPLTLTSNVNVFPAVGSPLTIAGPINGAAR